MSSNGKPLDYSTYLCLDKLLDAQEPQSLLCRGKIAHDEHLFIVVHQTYELWFKQLLFEVDWMRNTLVKWVGNSNKINNNRELPKVENKETALVVARAARCQKIMKLLVSQADILATMTPLDFMEFRSLLVPASGFQSVQFRMLENKLGQQPACRVTYNQATYEKSFEGEEEMLGKIGASEREASLCSLVEAWLEKVLDVEQDAFDFPAKYEAAVARFLKDEVEEIEKEPNEEIRNSLLLGHLAKEEKFRIIFDDDVHAQKRQRAAVRFSRKATLGAIMVMLYREEIRFHEIALVLELLMDLETELAKWRYAHMMLVQRMGPRPAACGIASKQQTGKGGSSGYQYLRATLSDRYRVFLDLFNLPAYYIPREYVPSIRSDPMKKVIKF